MPYHGRGKKCCTTGELETGGGVLGEPGLLGVELELLIWALLVARGEHGSIRGVLMGEGGWVQREPEGELEETTDMAA